MRGITCNEPVSPAVWLTTRKMRFTDLHIPFLKGDLFIRRLEVSIGQNKILFEHHSSLDHRNNAAGAFEVSDIGLDRSDEERVALRTSLGEGLIYRMALDGISHLGPGAMHLHESAIPRVQAGAPVDVTDESFLGLPIWLCDSLCLTVLVHAGVGYDCPDWIPIAHGIVERPQYDHAHALASCKSGLRSIIESEGFPFIVKKPVFVGQNFLVLTARNGNLLRHGHGHKQVRQHIQSATPHQCSRRVSAAQALHCIVQGDERRGTGRVDGHARSSQVEVV